MPDRKPPRRPATSRRPSASLSLPVLPAGKDTSGLMTWPVRSACGPDGKGDCRICKGRCCTYVVVGIPRPRSKVDVDEIRWFLAHENLQVYIEDGDWHLQFYTRCTHLTGQGLCDIYEDRFDVCREHDTETCEMSSGKTDETTFTTTEQFDRWWKRHKARNRRKRAKKS